jgi:hypothetical protein
LPIEGLAVGVIGSVGKSAASLNSVVKVDGAGVARIFIGEIEVGYHAAKQASGRDVTLNQITSTMSSGWQFAYTQGSHAMRGFYDAASNMFVAVGREVTTVIQPRAGWQYIQNLIKRE